MDELAGRKANETEMKQAKKLQSVEETMAWGRELAATLQAGDVIALVGNLGAGKTHAVKGMVEGLGSGEEVSSPTFTLVHEYLEGRLPVFHFDFYRLDAAGEVIGIGWDDFLDSAGVVIVEWADRFPVLFPDNTRWFDFEILADGQREVKERE